MARNDKKKLVNFWCERDLYEWFREHTKSEGVSMSSVLVNFLTTMREGSKQRKIKIDELIKSQSDIYKIKNTKDGFTVKRIDTTK